MDPCKGDNLFRGGGGGGGGGTFLRSKVSWADSLLRIKVSGGQFTSKKLALRTLYFGGQVTSGAKLLRDRPLSVGGWTKVPQPAPHGSWYGAGAACSIKFDT